MFPGERAPICKAEGRLLDTNRVLPVSLPRLGPLPGRLFQIVDPRVRAKEKSRWKEMIFPPLYSVPRVIFVNFGAGKSPRLRVSAKPAFRPWKVFAPWNLNLMNLIQLRAARS